MKIKVLPGGASTELEKAIEDYLIGVEARTRNRRTREFYAYSLGNVLLPFCRQQGIERLDQLDQRAVDRLAAELNARTLSAASVASYLRGVRQLLKWAGDRAPAVTVPRARVPKRDLQDQVLTRSEMDALVDSTTTVRDRALLELLTSTGLRLGEALALTTDDLIDHGRQGRFVAVRHRARGGGAKGDSSREVPIRPQLYTALRSLAVRRPADAITNRLFVTNRRRGKGGEYMPLAQRTVENMVKVAADRAGIKKRVHPHLLRHSFATAFMQARRDPVTLQRILGHADLTMIASTYSHPTSADLYGSVIEYLRGNRPDDGL